MPRTPEKDALQQMCATTNEILANQAQLTKFGDLVVSHNFLSRGGVSGILSIGADSNLTKVSKLMQAVETHITTTGSLEQTTKYFDEFILILHDDLDLENLAQQLVTKCQQLAFDKYNRVYKSPLPASFQQKPPPALQKPPPIELKKTPTPEPPQPTPDPSEPMKLQEVLDYVKVTEGDLNKKCSDAHLSAIAEEIPVSDWGKYAISLGLSDGFTEDLREDYRRAKEQRYKGLIEWRKQKAFRATYLALAKLFLEHKNADLAVFVCERVK